VSIDRALLQRRIVFAGVNLCAAFAVCMLVVLPLATYFGERKDEILETAGQLADVRAVTERASRLAKAGRSGPDPYLPAAEDRVASADLQAGLQALANGKGLQIQAVRGLPAVPKGRWRAIPVGLEVEGPVEALRDLVAAIEQQTPFLFITDISLRPLSDGDDGRMRASMTVEGALRGPAGSAPGPLLSEGRSGGVLAATER
jgi:hypothetical protein